MILDTIIKTTKERINKQKRLIPLNELIREAEALDRLMDFPFERALSKREMAFICEIKKASPSKGVIAEEFPYVEIAKEYQAAGAAAVSVLTEPHYFMGRDEYVKEIREHIPIPILRKDFIIDAYMIYEAKIMGADAILLICAILTDKELKEYMMLAHALGMSVLTETHNEEEIVRALRAEARIIGVNNRNLQDFTVDINTSLRLRQLVPESVVFVTESGIRTSADISILKQSNIHAVLIGETLMRSPDKKQMLTQLSSHDLFTEVRDT